MFSESGFSEPIAPPIPKAFNQIQTYLFTSNLGKPDTRQKYSKRNKFWKLLQSLSRKYLNHGRPSNIKTDIKLKVINMKTKKKWPKKKIKHAKNAKIYQEAVKSTKRPIFEDNKKGRILSILMTPDKSKFKKFIRKKMSVDFENDDMFSKSFIYHKMKTQKDLGANTILRSKTIDKRTQSIKDTSNCSFRSALTTDFKETTEDDAN